MKRMQIYVFPTKSGVCLVYVHNRHVYGCYLCVRSVIDFLLEKLRSHPEIAVMEGEPARLFGERIRFVTLEEFLLALSWLLGRSVVTDAERQWLLEPHGHPVFERAVEMDGAVSPADQPLPWPLRQIRFAAPSAEDRLLADLEEQLGRALESRDFDQARRLLLRMKHIRHEFEVSPSHGLPRDRWQERLDQLSEQLARALTRHDLDLARHIAAEITRVRLAWKHRDST